MSTGNAGQWARRNVLITGGAGFIGSNLAAGLVKLGAQVTVLDNYHPEYGANDANFEGFRESLRVVRGDITDRALMAELASSADVIYHSAAQCSHVDSMVDPWLDLRFNCEGTLSLFEGCKSAVKSGRKAPAVVYVSTRAVVGAPLQSPATETVLPNPTDVYGVNKMASEYYGAVYARVHGIPSVSLRLTNSFGPRHQMRHGKYGILNWFVSLCLQDKTLKIFGTGEQLRDYLYIDDAVEALIAAGRYAQALPTEGKPGRHRLSGEQVPYAVFNIASGKPERFVDCARKVVTTVGTGRLEMVPWPADRKAIETGDFVADSSEAHSVLGWKPRVSFDEGLKTTVDFYRERLNRYL
jgi:UDP-glucose 4-epimerase